MFRGDVSQNQHLMMLRDRDEQIDFFRAAVNQRDDVINHQSSILSGSFPSLCLMNSDPSTEHHIPGTPSLSSLLEQRSLYMGVERSLYAVRGVSPVKQTVQLPHVAVPMRHSSLQQNSPIDQINISPFNPAPLNDDAIARTFAINKQLPPSSLAPKDPAPLRLPPIAAPYVPLQAPAAKQAVAKGSTRTSVPAKLEPARAAERRPAPPVALPPLPANPKPEDLSFFNVKPLAYAVRPKDVRGLVR